MTTKMYNPDTQETVDVPGRRVNDHKGNGFIVVGNRPESEYVGKTREELSTDDEEETETLTEPGEPVPAEGDLPPDAAAAEAQAELESQSKDELYETATELDIEGRSTMNKAELVKAISEAKASE